MRKEIFVPEEAATIGLRPEVIRKIEARTGIVIRSQRSNGSFVFTLEGGVTDVSAAEHVINGIVQKLIPSLKPGTPFQRPFSNPPAPCPPPVSHPRCTPRASSPDLMCNPPGPLEMLSSNPPPPSISARIPGRHTLRFSPPHLPLPSSPLTADGARSIADRHAAALEAAALAVSRYGLSQAGFLAMRPHPLSRHSGLSPVALPRTRDQDKTFSEEEEEERRIIIKKSDTNDEREIRFRREREEEERVVTRRPQQEKHSRGTKREELVAKKRRRSRSPSREMESRHRKKSMSPEKMHRRTPPSPKRSKGSRPKGTESPPERHRRPRDSSSSNDEERKARKKKKKQKKDGKVQAQDKSLAKKKKKKPKRESSPESDFSISSKSGSSSTEGEISDDATPSCNLLSWLCSSASDVPIPGLGLEIESKPPNNAEKEAVSETVLPEAQGWSKIPGLDGDVFPATWSSYEDFKESFLDAAYTNPAAMSSSGGFWEKSSKNFWSMKEDAIPGTNPVRDSTSKSVPAIDTTPSPERSKKRKHKKDKKTKTSRRQHSPTPEAEPPKASPKVSSRAVLEIPLHYMDAFTQNNQREIFYLQKYTGTEISVEVDGSVGGKSLLKAFGPKKSVDKVIETVQGLTKYSSKVVSQVDEYLLGENLLPRQSRFSSKAKSGTGEEESQPQDETLSVQDSESPTPAEEGSKPVLVLYSDDEGDPFNASSADVPTEAASDENSSSHEEGAHGHSKSSANVSRDDWLSNPDAVKHQKGVMWNNPSSESGSAIEGRPTAVIRPTAQAALLSTIYDPEDGALGNDSRLPERSSTEDFSWSDDGEDDENARNGEEQEASSRKVDEEALAKFVSSWETHETGSLAKVTLQKAVEYVTKEFGEELHFTDEMYAALEKYSLQRLQDSSFMLRHKDRVSQLSLLPTLTAEDSSGKRKQWESNCKTLRHFLDLESAPEFDGDQAMKEKVLRILIQDFNVGEWKRMAQCQCLLYPATEGLEKSEVSDNLLVLAVLGEVPPPKAILISWAKKVFDKYYNIQVKRPLLTLDGALIGLPSKSAVARSKAPLLQDPPKARPSLLADPPACMRTVPPPPSRQFPVKGCLRTPRQDQASKPAPSGIAKFTPLPGEPPVLIRTSQFVQAVITKVVDEHFLKFQYPIHMLRELIIDKLRKPIPQLLQQMDTPLLSIAEFESVYPLKAIQNVKNCMPFSNTSGSDLKDALSVMHTREWKELTKFVSHRPTIMDVVVKKIVFCYSEYQAVVGKCKELMKLIHCVYLDYVAPAGQDVSSESCSTALITALLITTFLGSSTPHTDEMYKAALDVVDMLQETRDQLEALSMLEAGMNKETPKPLLDRL